MGDEPFELPPDILQQIPLFAEIAKVLAWRGGPVNWDLARQLAVAVAAHGAAAGEPSESDALEAHEDIHIAELWLAEATGLPAIGAAPRIRVLSPTGWAQQAADSYREIIDPLASRVTAAMAEQPGPGPGAAEGAEAFGQALAQMAPLFLGIQTGVALGTLARDSLGQYDIPLPPAEDGSVALVLPTIDAFAGAYHLDRREARLWLALHEVAHRLEFDGLPWVRPHFFALYHNQVAALEFDLAEMVERLQDIDLTDPAAIQESIGRRGLFGSTESAATTAAAERIEELVAILEAYADRAVAAAAAGRLPSASKIAEAAARRRAEEATGDRLFRRFVGVDLRTERRRAAEVFVQAVLEDGGWARLNRMWDEPEDLPSATELAEPTDWLRRVRRT